MVGPGGVARLSNFKDLKLQTCVSARIKAKGLFGALTNRKIVTAPVRDKSGWPVGSSGAKAGAAS
jgi:hypothetical protein